MQTTEPQTNLRLLAEGARAIGVELDARQVEQFAAYGRLLLEANRRVNLTAITEPEAVETLHFLDSLTAVAALPEAALNGGRVLDVASGAGFPGVPLRIAFPGVRVELLEATGKKAAFLRGLVDELGLDDVAVHQGRAEDLGREPSLRGAFDAVLARSVAKLATLAELTLPFLRVGGVLVAHKTESAADEVEAAGAAIAALGGEPPEVVPVTAPGLGGGRTLVVVRKTGETPDAYPRRAGMPGKRPIGS